jgi:hypothetical protein
MSVFEDTHSLPTRLLDAFAPRVATTALSGMPEILEEHHEIAAGDVGTYEVALGVEAVRFVTARSQSDAPRSAGRSPS